LWRRYLYGGAYLPSGEVLTGWRPGLLRITNDASIVPVDSDDLPQAEQKSGKVDISRLEADGEDPPSYRQRALLARTRHFFRPRGLLVVSKPVGLPSQVITSRVRSLVEQIPGPSVVQVDYEGQPTISELVASSDREDEDPFTLFYTPTLLRGWPHLNIMNQILKRTGKDNPRQGR